MEPVLIHLRPWNAATNQRVDVYVADAAVAEVYGLNATSWEPAVRERPELSIQLFDHDMTGRVQTGKMSLSLALSQIVAVANPQLLYWTGAPVFIYSVEDLAWQRRVTEFVGRIAGADLDKASMTLGIDGEVDTKLIEKPLLRLEFTGGGGLLGDGDKRGVLKPAGFGEAFNIEPVWFDLTDNIGMIDGYGNCLSIDWLGEGLSATGFEFVANYATYALLKAAIVGGAIGKGQWGTSIADGCVGLGAPPEGRITVHATFGAGTPGAWMERLLLTHAQVAADKVVGDSFDALDAQLAVLLGEPATIGAWFSEQRQIPDLLAAIAASCNATPIVDFQGRCLVTRAVPSAPVAALDYSGATEPRVTKHKSLESPEPFYRMQARTARPAAVFPFADVNYVDTIDDSNGLWLVGDTYRAGDVVWRPDGSRFLYIADEPSAGHEPPPATSPPDPPAADAWWQQLLSPTAYSDGTPIDDLRPEEAGANVTETNTAAAFLGQGALATANQVNLGASGSVYRQDTVTKVTDATAITALGTAAAIAGQGAGATANNLTQLNATEGAKLTGVAIGATADITLEESFAGHYTLAGGTATRLTATNDWVNGFSKETFTGGAIVIGTFDTVDTVIGITSTKTAPGGAADYTTIDYGVMRNSNGAWYYKNPGTALVASLGAGFTAAIRWAFLYDSVAGRVYAIADGVIVWTWTGVAANLKMQAAFSTASVVGRKVGNLGIAPVVGQVGATLGSRAGTNLFRTDGTTVMTQGEVRTAEGTAAAFAGQGALATASQVNLGATGRVYREDAVTRLTDSLAVTSLGTAAAFTGQGALATLGNVYFGSSLLLEASGGSQATLPNFKTALGTAAALLGQGWFATQNTADFATRISGIDRPDRWASASDNVVRNPRFLNGAEGWGLTNVALLDAGPDGLVFSCGVANGVASQTERVPLPQANRVFFSYERWVDAGGVGTINFDFWLYNAAGTATDFGAIAGATNVGGGGYRVASTSSPNATWTKVKFTLQLPVGAHFIRPTPALFAGGGQTSRIRKIRIAATEEESTLGAIASTNLFRSDGATVLSQSEVRTAEGTAAAFVGQGSLATRSTALLGTHIYRQDAVTVVTDATAITALGTAAAFSGQGALATLSQVNFGASGRVYRDDGATRVTDAAAITALGTSAALAGQGWFATQSSVSLEDNTRITNKTRISKLAAATGVAADSSILPANTQYGLIPSLKTIGAISDTDNAGTVTLNIGSSVFYPDAGGTVTFPTANLAGKAYNTTYFIKRQGVDPVSAPTGTAYDASTTLSIGVGEVYINYFTTRLNGGSPPPPPPPPPGGGGWCVAGDAWVETRDRGFVCASNVRQGDLLRVLTDDLEATRWEPCRRNHVAHEPAVRLVTARGFTLRCSVSTPLTLRDGASIRAPNALGREVPIFDGELAWDEVVAVEPAGCIVVAHIRCNQKTYAAGDVAGRSILTHNPDKP